MTPNGSSWLDELFEPSDPGERFAMITVCRVYGSSPREIGATMLVSESRCVDTIGGGQLEYWSTKEARNLLSMKRSPKMAVVAQYPLGIGGGQCCGGTVDVLIEVLCPRHESWLSKLRSERTSQNTSFLVTELKGGQLHQRYIIDDQCVERLPVKVQRLISGASGTKDSSECKDAPSGKRYLVQQLTSTRYPVSIFGAGHVGGALIHLLGTLPFEVSWFDSRPGIFPDRLPKNVSAMQLDYPHLAIDRIDPRSLVVVMTHDHRVDLEICHAALSRAAFPFVGLIGSETKKSRFTKRLRSLGIGDNPLAQLACPIGEGPVTGKTPAEIAIAVATQILCIRKRLELSGNSSTELAPHRQKYIRNFRTVK